MKNINTEMGAANTVTITCLKFVGITSDGKMDFEEVADDSLEDFVNQWKDWEPYPHDLSRPEDHLAFESWT